MANFENKEMKDAREVLSEVRESLRYQRDALKRHVEARGCSADGVAEAEARVNQLIREEREAAIALNTAREAYIANELEFARRRIDYWSNELRYVKQSLESVGAA